MNFDWQSLFAQILPLFPAQIAADMTLIGTSLITFCAVLARFMTRPAATSKWLPLYEVINSLAQNRNKASNADDAKR